jgi:endogenous inhibitor of DNA gyrase (YacG/DUF329 family)
MTEIKRYASITEKGVYDFVCATCGLVAKIANPKLVYCSERCQKIAYSRRYYRKNRDRVKAATLTRIRQSRKEAKSKKH